jgi:hypothetical protein
MISDSELAQTLLALEQRLLQPEVRRSRQELEKLLAEDFVEIGSSGKIYNLAAIIAELDNEQEIRIALSNFEARPLAPGIALVTYRAVISETESQKPKHSLRSSIWKLIGDNWRMIFHQGTPSGEPM